MKFDTKRYKTTQFELKSYVSIPLLFLGGENGCSVIDGEKPFGGGITLATGTPHLLIPTQNATK